MEERLIELGKEVTVKKVVDNINKVVNKNFEILVGENDIEKWNTVPKLIMMKEDEQKLFLSFIEFMDSLLLPVDVKAVYVISLSGLIYMCDLKLKDYDNGSLFLLADYYRNKKEKEIEKTLPVAGNQDLLFAIRTKTLDLEVRKQVLGQILDEVIEAKLDVKTSKKVKDFVQKTVKDLENKDFYQLINEEK